MRHRVLLSVNTPDEMTPEQVNDWVKRAMKLAWEDYLRRLPPAELHPTEGCHSVIGYLPEAFAYYGVRATWDALVGPSSLYVLPWPHHPSLAGAAYNAWKCINRARMDELLPDFMGQVVKDE